MNMSADVVICVTLNIIIYLKAKVSMYYVNDIDWLLCATVIRYWCISQHN